MNKQIIKIVVGLGNPEYWRRNTRHNIGFKILEEFVDYTPSVKEGCISEFKYDETLNACIAKYNSSEYGISFLCLPLCGMNSSGDSVKKLVERIKEEFPGYKIKVLIVHDDLDLPAGVVRYRRKSSTIQHNGVRSIVESIDVSSISFLKFGIGRPEDGTTILDWVLGDIPREELHRIGEYGHVYEDVSSMFAACELIRVFLENGTADAFSAVIQSFDII